MLCVGFPGRNSNCLDQWGDPVIWAAGGGLRERPQRLLQEADRDAQQSHHSPSRLTLKGRKTESRDNLYWPNQSQTQRWWQSAQSMFTQETLSAKWFSTRLSLLLPSCGSHSFDTGDSANTTTNKMSEVGRGGGWLLCKHLWRRVPILARVSGKHTETCDNTPHWQVGNKN